MLVEPIKQFVQGYNTTIDQINSMVKEKFIPITPLTDEQREND